jgi:hypothetical protein
MDVKWYPGLFTIDNLSRFTTDSFHLDFFGMIMQRPVKTSTRWYNTEHKHSGLKFITPVQSPLAKLRRYWNIVSRVPNCPRVSSEPMEWCNPELGLAGKRAVWFKQGRIG